MVSEDLRITESVVSLFFYRRNFLVGVKLDVLHERVDVVEVFVAVVPLAAEDLDAQIGAWKSEASGWSPKWVEFIPDLSSFLIQALLQMSCGNNFEL